MAVGEQDGNKLTAAVHQIDLNSGFYTAAEAARLLGLRSAQPITRWLAPTRAAVDPVVKGDFAKVGREHELSFLDLIEVRFVEHFRRIGISLQSLRKAASNARDRLGDAHPFAQSDTQFRTDRRKVFSDTARETNDRELLDLMTNQYAMFAAIERSLDADLTFDASGLARQWRPSPDKAPDVIVAPNFAFGRPVISLRRVPTRTLFESWKAEGGEAGAVASWFAIEEQEVEQAVRYELTLH